MKKNKMPPKLAIKSNLLSDSVSNSISNVDSEFEQPLLMVKKSFIGYVVEKGWHIWAVIVGGLILIYLGWRK